MLLQSFVLELDDVSLTKASQTAVVEQSQVKSELQPASEKPIDSQHEELQPNEPMDKGKASQLIEDTETQQRSGSPGEP